MVVSCWQWFPSKKITVMGHLITPQRCVRTLSYWLHWLSGLFVATIHLSLECKWDKKLDGI